MSKPSRPLKWLRETPVEEISEAMLSIDPIKAAELATLLLAHSGRSVGERLDRALGDPEKAVGDFLSGGFRRLMK